ncbi:MAG: cytochrome c [Spirosomaceae bacterium]|nr:cytochrome c [Spirosomataceae bacterium]
MNFFNNHTKLFVAATALFCLLMLFVAIFPALNNQNDNAPLPNSVALTNEEFEGKKVYISEGCVGCHSQQVRNVEMDKVWGDRPNIAADYARSVRTSFLQNTATLMGTERTGPDLTNIGIRQASIDWHLLHLYNPRAVVKESIMPAHPWLFEVKENPAEKDVIVNVPADFMNGKNGKVVASEKVLNLVAYLLSLKQVELPDGSQPEFLYKKPPKAKGESSEEEGLDGEALYAANCQSCHQPNGEGLKGAFPPLKGSAIVLDDNAQTMLEIIMIGYNAREEYGVMPAVGNNNKLTAEEVTAIMNHERTSWGNNGRKVTLEEIKKYMQQLNASTPVAQ